MARCFPVSGSLCDGEVKLHINGFVVGYLDAPLVFGELQLLAICRDWPVELEADTWTCILELRREDLLMCFSENQVNMGATASGGGGISGVHETIVTGQTKSSALERPMHC